VKSSDSIIDWIENNPEIEDQETKEEWKEKLESFGILTFGKLKEQTEGIFQTLFKNIPGLYGLLLDVRERVEDDNNDDGNFSLS
jgi:hypothetical protein